MYLVECWNQNYVLQILLLTPGYGCIQRNSWCFQSLLSSHCCLSRVTLNLEDIAMHRMMGFENKCKVNWFSKTAQEDDDFGRRSVVELNQLVFVLLLKSREWSCGYITLGGYYTTQLVGPNSECGHDPKLDECMTYHK